MKKKPPFVDEMNFSKPWRPYQARVLEKLGDYLENRHFHLVSAPGSGKTVTGLEVMRRIGKPTLVLAPTIAIREQWVDRLTTDFLGGRKPDWISRDIKKPAPFTICTYQSISSEFRKEDGVDRIIDGLEKTGVATLVVDEAHHLRAVWWKCLAMIKDGIKNPFVVALTATPPIDVPGVEWSRYASFCGPVDIEVGVPELVGVGNLCPHQDFVHFSVPSGRDVGELQRFHRGVGKFLGDLAINVELAENLGLNSPVEWIESPDDLDFLRQHQTFFLSLAIFLQTTGGYVPENLRNAYQIDGEELPAVLDVDWAEALLQGILFDFREKIESTPGIAESLPEELAELEFELRELGAIEKRTVVLRDNAENERILRDSSSKLESIAKIIEHESQAQGALMRAVILTDYIRKEAFPTQGNLDPPLVKLGVVPIFEWLRKIRLPFVSPGALTGSIVIIPKVTRLVFEKIAKKRGIDLDGVTASELFHDRDFLEISVRENDRQRLVVTITELFEKGHINCLIGTAALLGEGWDAPALNTLVLASVIGSFVMSNQMRGRAIRTNPAFPEKISNIWHIATINPELNSDGSYEPGADFSKLERRFEAFHGVGFELDDKGKAIVENGWNRLGVGLSITPEEVAEHNRRMYSEAENRENIQFVWRRAIEPISEGRFLRAIQELQAPRRIAASRFIAAVSGKAGKGARHRIGGWLEGRRLRKIANAILKTLIDRKIIGSSYRKGMIRITVGPKRCYISAPSLESTEQVKFISSLDEFFDAFQSPRYLIHQKGRYFSVPRLLDNRKEEAERFSIVLAKSGFGKHDLIFAHSPEGRKHLLEARKQRMLNHFAFKTDTSVTWKPFS